MPPTEPVPSAPLDRRAVEAALAPHGSSVLLPASAYTSADVLAWERRYLFAGAWTCLGRADELAAADGHPVTHRAVMAGDVGVLLSFGDAGVHGFANVCRHRGHELLPAGTGAARRAVVCPYHGWAYDLEGRLRVAPGLASGDVDFDFDFDRHGLVELPVRGWQGWLFVNALGGAPDFDAYAGAMTGLVEPYRPAQLRLAARHGYRVAANWKVLVENYHECYHCPLIHPELCQVSPPTSGENWRLPGAWVGGSMRLREHAETMSLDGRSEGAFLSGVDRRTVRYLGLFPNLLVSAHPDYVMAHRLEPLAPDATFVECSWYMPDGVTDATYAVQFWDLTNQQDWAACESVQRGLSSPHFRPGPLALHEDAVHQWVSLVAACYLDPVGALARAAAGHDPAVGESV